jgi:hypothetical protein
MNGCRHESRGRPKAQLNRKGAKPALNSDRGIAKKINREQQFKNVGAQRAAPKKRNPRRTQREPKNTKKDI